MKKILLLLISIFCIGIGHAQTDNTVTWSITLKQTDTTQCKITYTALIAPGWHLYSAFLPENGPMPTTFNYDILKGAEAVGKIVEKGDLVKKYDETFDMEISWFAGQATFEQDFKITDPSIFQIKGYTRYMVCNDQTCLAPTTEEFSFNSKDLKQTSAATVPPTEKKKQDEPSISEPDSSVAETVQDSTIAIATQSETNLWTPVIKELHSFGSTPITEDTSFWILFISGFAGGLLALLTPCVWPMIPMTVSFFLKRGKNKKKSIQDAFIYGISIIVIYLGLGLIITALFGASALNSLSTNAIFNILFFALLVLFAISFFGAFEITLPASWTTKLDQKADSAKGLVSLFFMAFTLVLVSFSCTGPIIGTLLVQAASMGTAIGPAIGMFGFALALSIPFSLFAIFPSWLQQLPKSGGWLNSVKVVLGFLELALAFKFLSVADLAYGWHILDRETFIVIWVVIFFMLGLYLLGKLKFSHDSDLSHISVTRLFLAIVSFSFSLYMVPGLWGAPLKSISAFTPPLVTQDFNLYKNEVHAKFDNYEAGMLYAKEVKKPVLIDFSGYGCVNCRKMEASVWTNPKVKELIENDFVLITLMVDDKTSLPEPMTITENGKERILRTIGDKWSYLQRYKFGANAQPYYVILNNEGTPLEAPYAYDENIDNYVKFLETGLKRYKTN